MKLLSHQTHFASFLVLSLFAGAVSAWQPRPGWRDSYAVAGICYCDSSNYDHGIGKVKPLASDRYQRTVQQVCTDITTKFGVEPQVGRIPYNTIACGNSPANDAPDEDLITGCAGRVDQGEAGCFEIGRQWPLDKLYGAPIKALDRGAWKISASDKNINTAAMADGNPNTRWSTNRKQAPGQWIEIDLGQAQKINVVDLEAVGSRHDFPVAWRLEVSAQG